MKWNEAVREFFQPAEAVRTIPQAVAQASRGGVALLLYCSRKRIVHN